MDVSAAYILDRLAARDLLPFLLFAGIEFIFAIAGILIHLPIAMLLPAMLLAFVLIVQSPIVMLISLFATFSIAIHISVFTADTLILIPLIVYWFFTRTKKERTDGDSFRWPRRLAFANLVWITAIFLWHWDDFGVSGYTIGTGVRLIFYFVMFIVVLDIAKRMRKEDILLVLQWAWFFSVIVSLVAIFQHYVLGENRVSSILEVHHSHLGNYAVVAAMLGGIMTVLSENKLLKTLAFLSVFLALVALVLSETRSDIVGIGVGLAVFGLLRGVRGIVVVALIAGILLGTGVVSHVLHKEETLTFQEQAQERMTRSGVEANYDPSAVDRIMMWIGVLSMEQHEGIQQRLTGDGPGNFYYFMRPYFSLHALYLEYPNASSNGAHNNYLQVLVDLGFIGLLIFMIFYFTILLFFVKTKKIIGDKFNSMNDIAIAGTLALLISGFTQETFYSQSAMGNFMGLYIVVIVLLMVILNAKLGKTIDGFSF